MKITLSKSQWEFIGKKAGWMDSFINKSPKKDEHSIKIQKLINKITNISPILSELSDSNDPKIKEIAENLAKSIDETKSKIMLNNYPQFPQF
jgi:hypothetical protein